MRIALLFFESKGKMNVVIKKWNHFVEWFKMVVLSLFFGKFPRMVYEQKISYSYKHAVDDKISPTHSCVGYALMCITLILVAIFSTYQSIDVYQAHNKWSYLFIFNCLLAISSMILFYWAFKNIQEISKGVKSRMKLMDEVLDVLGVKDPNEDEFGRYDFEKWLTEMRPYYEMGEKKGEKWQLVFSFFSLVWPNHSKEDRFYITTELGTGHVNTSWTRKVRMVRINHDVSVKDLKRVLEYRKGLIERPKDSIIQLNPQFDLCNHDVFEFSDMSPESVSINRLKVRKESVDGEGISFDNELTFDKEDRSGIIHKNDYLVFFSRR
jgi:hypothetical protein